jgi:hypothetical protein
MDQEWIDGQRAGLGRFDEWIEAITEGKRVVLCQPGGVERALTVDDVDDLRLARDVSVLLLDGMDAMLESSPAPDWAVRAVE